jgi:hypothetical protein
MKIIRFLSAAEAAGTCFATIATQSLYLGFSFNKAFTRSRVVGVNCWYAIYATVMCPRSFQPNACSLIPAANINPNTTPSTLLVNFMHPSDPL